MRRRLGVALAALPGPAGAAPPRPPTAPPPCAPCSTRRSRPGTAATSRASWPAYWRSPDLVFCSGATVTKGWDETLARYRKRYQSEGREMGRLRFDAVEVVPLGEDAALARGAWRLVMSDGKQPHGLFTLLLRRVDGAWRIVHDHTSSGE